MMDYKKLWEELGRLLTIEKEYHESFLDLKKCKVLPKDPTRTHHESSLRLCNHFLVKMTRLEKESK